MARAQRTGPSPPLWYARSTIDRLPVGMIAFTDRAALRRVRVYVKGGTYVYTKVWDPYYPIGPRRAEFRHPIVVERVSQSKWRHLDHLS